MCHYFFYRVFSETCLLLVISTFHALFSFFTQQKTALLLIILYQSIELELSYSIGEFSSLTQLESSSIELVSALIELQSSPIE